MVYDKSVIKLLQVYGDDPVHVTPTVIIKIYERIFGHLPTGCIKDPTCQTDDVLNISRILSYLQDYVLKVDLSHIDSLKVVHGDPISVEYLLEILAGYVEYILDGDGDNSQNISDLTDEEATPKVVNKTYTPTKEILSESPIRSILRFDDESDSTDEIIVEPEIRNTSAFLAGYKEGMATSYEPDDLTVSIDNKNKASLLDRLNQLPNLSEALKNNGVDVHDYSASSEQISKVNDTDELLEATGNTNDLLAASVSDLGDCVAQSTPYPTKAEYRVSSPVATQTDQNVVKSQEYPKTPDQKLDESIKTRLLFLLEQSGNKKSQKRQVRFNVPDSPNDETEDPNKLMEQQRFEYELEKRILEEELKEKVDQLVLEKKKLREITKQRTTPRPPKKKPIKKTPQSKTKPNATKSEVKASGPQSTNNVIQDYLLPQMLDDFPYLHVSPQTARVLWNKQVKQINALTQTDGSKTKLIKKHLEEEERRQELLLNLMKKELEFVNRVSNENAIKDEKRLLTAKLREKKLTTARVRKYHQDYCRRTKARMCNKSYKEEVMFKQLFEKGLKVQKENLLEAKRLAKEDNETARMKHEKNTKELENYYTDQFDLMATEVDKAKKEKEILQQEKRLRLNKQKIHQRQKMKEEIEVLQENLVRSDEHLHYKEIEFDKALQNIH
ncbi:centrosomal protein of 95 kDa-like [Bolinopsis microptera]|uniref:centrosomal protein of 95 kDa-like n=1 Tax=Bolinopsis microptera TaxID=2820187 RepID=UPI00307A0C5E